MNLNLLDHGMERLGQGAHGRDAFAVAFCATFGWTLMLGGSLRFGQHGFVCFGEAAYELGLRLWNRNSRESSSKVACVSEDFDSVNLTALVAGILNLSLVYLHLEAREVLPSSLS